MLLEVIILVLLGLYLYQSCCKPRNFPPGPPRLPLVGSYWFMLWHDYMKPHLAFEALAKKYRTNILGVFLGGFPCVVTLDYQLTKEMLNRDEFIGRPDTVIIRARNLDQLNGIFFSNGLFWKEERRFSLRHLRDFGFGRRSTAVEECWLWEVRNMIQLCLSEPNALNKDVCRSKGEVLVPDVFHVPILSQILPLLISKPLSSTEMRNIARSAMRFQASTDPTGCAITFLPWLKYIAPTYFGYKSAVEDNGVMLDYLRPVVQEHIQTFSLDHQRDFIDAYLHAHYENGHFVNFDLNHVLLVLMDYMFAAPVALGNTLSICFAYLIKYPKVQEKIQNEIDQVVGTSRLPTLDDRKMMPYTEASIKECLRICPINPLGITRRCVKDTTLAGYTIPKNTVMLPCVWAAHKDPKIWSEPDAFKPERFLCDDGRLCKADYTMGFGNGKRVCAGETFSKHLLFVLISGLLQHFNIESWNGRPVDFTTQLKSGLSLYVVDHWVRMKPRAN